MTRVVLLSSSTIHGRGYLDHAEAAIRDLFGNVDEVVFVPFALFDQKAYATKVRKRFEALGLPLVSLHAVSDPRATVERARGIFVGGGNTFRLLKSLEDHDLLETIRARVGAGVPYLGSSAGSIVAGPTIRTTKDMPILEPRSFDALGLVPFQVSPHYLDPDLATTHMGETQEERIFQFLEENDAPVAGMREGAILSVDDRSPGSSVLLGGTAGVRVFRRGHDPVEVVPVCRLEPALLRAAA